MKSKKTENTPRFATFDENVTTGIGVFGADTPTTKNKKTVSSHFSSPPASKVRTGIGELEMLTQDIGSSLADGWNSALVTGKNLFSRNSSLATIGSSGNEGDSTSSEHRLHRDRVMSPPLPSAKHSGLLNSSTKEFPPSRESSSKSLTTAPVKTDYQKEDLRMKQHYATKKYTFQTPSERMAVSVRTVQLSTRTAFARMNTVTGSTIRAMVEEMIKQRKNKGDIEGFQDIERTIRLVSPSPQFVDIVLNPWLRITSVRQLCWSPSVSREADPFIGWTDDENDDQESMETENQTLGSDLTNKVSGRIRFDRKKRLAKKRRKMNAMKDGRYHQIDTTAYIKETLPDHYPVLTNLKLRLPMRSDVGFPRATLQEVALKEEEVRKETQLEEISPRLIILLSSDHFTNLSEEVDELVQPDARGLLTHKVPGMIFAGKDLAAAKYRNIKAMGLMKKCSQYSQKSITSSSTHGETGEKEKKIASHSRKDVSQQMLKLRQTKPNPASVFAPPHGATFSSAQMWRSKPFSDRISGLVNFLAIPMDIRFDIGDIEPLTCTLALYYLPGQNDVGGKKGLRSKISEDFIFPAGDWKGILDESVGETTTRNVGFNINSDVKDHKEMSVNEATEQHEQSWRTLKRKALFSFDPLEVSSHPDDLRCDNVYLVMQVYKVAHKEAARIYLDKDARKAMSKSVGSRIRDSLSGSRKQYDTPDFSNHEKTLAEKRAVKCFDSYGTQFLTPLCFGMLPIFPHDEIDSLSGSLDNKNICWPNGASQTMHFFAHSSSQESHEAFMDRLSSLSLCLVQSTNNITAVSSNLIDSTTDVPSRSSFNVINQRDESDRSMLSPPISKNGRHLTKKHTSFLSFKRASCPVPVSDNDSVSGYAHFFTSIVDTDFTQVMLYRSSIFEQENAFVQNQRLPRLLVDVSGDFAILCNPTDEQNGVVKRSNLMRLPACSKPSGYIESTEIRDVLYMPPLTQPNFCNIPLSSRSTTSLLYMYPRLLKRLSDEVDRGSRDTSKTPSCGFTIRIGLVQKLNEHKDSRPRCTSLENVYNPCPGKVSMLSSVYTKISTRAAVADTTRDFHFRDEIKIRLPEILDESFFLHLSLCAVDFGDDGFDNFGGLEIHPLAETWLPLKLSSTCSGIHVDSIMPSGLHQADIGYYQLHFETRLASNVHISDPFLSAALRECPSLVQFCFPDKATIERSSLLHLSLTPIPSFCSLLSKVSSQNLRSFFYPLTYYVLGTCLGLASHGITILPSESTSPIHLEALSELWTTFLELLIKVKASSISSTKGESALTEIFFKSFIDEFDEASLFDRQHFHGSIESQTDQHLSTSEINTGDFGIEVDIDERLSLDHERNMFDSQARRTVRYSLDEKIFQRKEFQLARPSQPFSRRAYGNSKIDRMKAEAELYESGQLRSDFMDDDETIFSSGTWQTAGGRSLYPVLSKQSSGPGERADTAVSLFSNLDGRRKDSYPIARAKSMVKHVNTVAQIFMTPCVAPSVSTGSPTSKSLMRSAADNRANKQRNLSQNDSLTRGALILTTASESRSSPYLPGSDVEDESIFNESTIDVNTSFFTPNPDLPLRGSRNLSVLVSSFSGSSKSLNNAKPYVYEVILFLWRQTWISVQHSKNVSSSAQLDMFSGCCDFLVPLCLKSLILRCIQVQRTSLEVIPSLVFDASHMMLLVSLTEVTARSFVMRSSHWSNRSEADVALCKALSSNDLMVDFLTGLFTVIHPAQVAWLVSKYIMTLRDCERDDKEGILSSFAILRSRCSRLLRLRAAEKLSSLPRFIALNFPYKYTDKRRIEPSQHYSWVSQAQKKNPGICTIPPSANRLPESTWLAHLLASDCFAICSVSWSMLISEAHASANSTSRQEELAFHKSISLQAITIVYELLLRSNATDSRYQSEDASCRIAGMFVSVIVECSIEHLHILEEMNSFDQIRMMWLSCLSYVLQESSESALRSVIQKSKFDAFVRILQLCSDTFLCFMEGDKKKFFGDDSVSIKTTPWLAQESYNTISAAVILLIDESCNMRLKPLELIQGVRDVFQLLLFLLTVPQSSVTLLRILGATSHALDKFSGSIVIEAIGDSLQHWGRVLFTLMNNTSLSVRSMVVDFIVSFFCSSFKEGCDFHKIVLIFLSILPEVVAREIGLFSASGHIDCDESIERCVWPIRRALADIESSDPVDDDRIDAALLPFLSQFCRRSQAIIDGVLIELRMRGHYFSILPIQVPRYEEKSQVHYFQLRWLWDADEESLLEAANAFDPETGCLQRIRWLLSLKSLHDRKEQWLEAGETLVLCAYTISESIPHIKNCWIPSRFDLWQSERSPPSQKAHTISNLTLASFFDSFLHPSQLHSILGVCCETGSFIRPTVVSMCKLLISIIAETVNKFEQEDGIDALALLRMEQLMKVMMSVIEDHATHTFNGLKSHSISMHNDIGVATSCAGAIEENAALRQVSATLNEIITKLSEKLFRLAKIEQSNDPSSPVVTCGHMIYYVQLFLCGKKPERFNESTTIPTFLPFGVPCICRVPSVLVTQVWNSPVMKQARGFLEMGIKLKRQFEKELCRQYAGLYIEALGLSEKEVQICDSVPDENSSEYISKTFVVVRCVSPLFSSSRAYTKDDFDRYLVMRSGETKKFYFENHGVNQITTTVEITVAQRFPGALSRQPHLFTTEFITSTSRPT